MAGALSLSDFRLRRVGHQAGLSDGLGTGVSVSLGCEVVAAFVESSNLAISDGSNRSLAPEKRATVMSAKILAREWSPGGGFGEGALGKFRNPIARLPAVANQTMRPAVNPIERMRIISQEKRLAVGH